MPDRFSFRYAKAVLAWGVLHLWPGLLPTWMFWILPSVGDYAYWDDEAFVEARAKSRRPAP